MDHVIGLRPPTDMCKKPWCVSQVVPGRQVCLVHRDFPNYHPPTDEGSSSRTLEQHQEYHDHFRRGRQP